MRKEKVMKKRMIAWLLCACMTFTAAPEILLADVVERGQIQENRRNETDEAESQTEGQDNSESMETESAWKSNENVSAKEEKGTDETKTVTEEPEKAGTESVTEITEDGETEDVTEETEVSETEAATEETEAGETEAATEETEVSETEAATEENEVSEIEAESEQTEETVETELTEETEGIEEVTEETESIELTAEEQEEIEQEISDEISLFSAAGSYSLTEEQLYMLAPSYLNNKAYDDIIAKCGDMSLDAINSVSATDETVASFMYSIKTGSSVLWKEFWSKCNLGDNSYESFEKQAAREVVYEYLQANQDLTKTAGKVEENLKVVNKVYDFLKDKDKEAYRKTLVENNKNKLMSDEKIGEMVDGLYENMDLFMKFTNDTNEIFLMVSGMIEIQEIEVQAIDDLMIIHEHVKDPSIYNELIALRNEIVENPAQYIVDHYLSDKVLSALQKEAKKAAGSIVSGMFDYSSLPWGIVNKAAGMIASVYERYNPSVSDIVYSSLLYQYWMDSNRAVAHYQHLFYTGKGTTDDMRYLEAAVNFNAACTKMLLSKSKNLVKSRDKRLYSKMDCWESSMGSEVNYELYINSCLSNATKAVNDGTLTIKDDSATIRDNNGNVIDENYDSTASIKAKFAAIQSQYKPNAGQTWNGDWGGAIQCFGFARMVFYQLFGCNMPNRYYGNAKYKYQSEENVDLVGQISGSSVTTDSAKNLLQQGKLGDIIQACGSGNGGQHTMVFVSADDNGVTVYDCNARLSASEPACVIHQWTIKWSTWASYYGSGDSSSENGISLYRASNYAQIYGDGDGMFYDDSVNFVIENSVLKKYNGWQTFVEIPDTVTAIGDEAFKNNTSMVSVSIPDSVKSIGDSAFYGCTSLLGVVIPDSVEKVGRCAFQKCSKLASAYLPVNEKFTFMSAYMFESCKSLKKIEIPDNVTNIGPDEFENCTELSSVILSKNLRTIGGYAFRNDNKLTEIEIPKSLEKCSNGYGYGQPTGIVGGAFQNCANLKTVTFEEGTTEIAEALFAGCTGIKQIKIPDTVTVIESWAFGGCINLTEIEIPDSVTKIERAAFGYCSSLKEIELSENLESMGAYAFQNCNVLKNIVIPDSVTNIELEAFENCTELSNVILSKNLKTIGGRAFENDNKLTEREIPKSLEECSNGYGYGQPTGIVGGAFQNCANLKTVTFEEGTTEIAKALFAGCTGIEQIKIPDTVTVIESWAFGGCINLKEIDVPNSVTEIQRSAFEYCSSLKAAKLSENLKSIGMYSFNNCTSLIEVHLSDILKEIPAGTFSGCKKLTTINFPSTLTTIGDSAFSGCESLPEAILPSGVEKIESNAFKNCKSLKKAVVPDTVSSIGSSAFYGCEALTDITLGSKLKKIDSQTFYGCAALPSIVLPYSVTAIGDSAFVNCTKLTQITVPRNTTSIASNAFSYPKKMTMYGPSGCYAQTYANGKGMKYVAQDIHATSISLDITTKTAERYDEFQLTATIAPQNFTDAVTWTSSNEDVAAVSDTGYVEICGVGTAVITVTAGNVNASCTVNVPQLISWIEFDEDEIELKIGKTYQLKTDISPSDATNKKLEYTSSNTEVAEVSATGLVTAKSAGSAQIKASSTDGSGEYAICYVTVSGNSNNNTENNNNGDNTGGSNDSNGDNTGGSSNKDNTGSGGNKDNTGSGSNKNNTGSGSNKDNTGNGSNKNNNSSENEEKVKVKGITLNKTSATVNRGKKLTLKAAVSPSEAANKKVVFKSGNTKVATVDNSGKVTAKAPGKTKITVTSSEDSSYQASCTITVPYKITYKLNKGKNNASNPSTYYAKKITLKNPTRKGYAFAGWYKDAKFKKKIKTISSNARCDYTLYAKWTKVKVEKVSLTSAKNSKGKKIVLKSKKVSGAKGYEISYSTDKKFKKAVTKKNTTKTSYTISKLKKGKTYYVRIRAYKVDSTGKKVYGKYSSVKKVKISK